MNPQSSKTLAEKIAGILESENESLAILELRDAVDRLSARLDELEGGAPPARPAGSTVGRVVPMPVTHSSGETFSVREAREKREGANGTQEEICAYEPNDKPCDHCLMCSCRGF